MSTVTVQNGFVTVGLGLAVGPAEGFGGSTNNACTTNS